MSMRERDGERMQPPGDALRFCLITAGNVSNRPRLLKAADALVAAGHVVRVVALDIDPAAAARDEATVRHRGWILDRVDLRSHRVRGILLRAMNRAGQWLAWTAWRAGRRGAGVEDRALCRYLSLLTRRARGLAADIVIGHGVEALPVAARAAASIGARYGFDSEDFHVGELPDAPPYRARRSLIAAVEARYLPRSAYITASTDGIADALVLGYGVSRPVVVLNTFPPRAEVPPLVDAGMAQGSATTLYWFSQVVGPGRGIEDAVEALGLLGGSTELHLRGRCDTSFVNMLMTRARELGVAERIHILPVVPPDELVELASRYDIGLALELTDTDNHRLCVANKLFSYLVAGLAVAVSDTPGQQAIMSRAPGAGFVYRAGDPQTLAEGLRRLVANPEALASAKRAALGAATHEFPWERDASRLVGYLTRPQAFGSRR